MPQFRVPYAISGEMTIRADDALHAEELFNRKTIAELALAGELQSDDPEEIPRDTEGALIDRHWDRMKEPTAGSA